MKKTRFISLSTAIVAMLSVVGCSGSNSLGSFSSESTVNTLSLPNTIIESSSIEEETFIFETEPVTEVETIAAEPVETLSEEQKNAIAMLNFITNISIQIANSKDNRYALEEVKQSLKNNLNLSKIDDVTYEEIDRLLRIIDRLCLISDKRSQLKQLYEQDTAKGIQDYIGKISSILPGFLEILTKHDQETPTIWKCLALQVTCSAIDVLDKQQQEENEAILKFMFRRNRLDNNEITEIQNAATDLFGYTWKTLKQYNLPDEYTLSDGLIQKFVDEITEENIHSIKQFLETNMTTYQYLDSYWLELGKVYYEQEKYQDCLDCIEQYNNISTNIFKKDHAYALFLPKAITAAQNLFDGDDYITIIERLTDDLSQNTEESDWSLNYFASLSYFDLFTRTQSYEYLEKAYTLALTNVRELSKEQKKLSDAYKNKLEKPDTKSEQYSKEEKQLLDEDYKSQTQKRKTECPPIYEPLILNCDLLYELTKQMSISENEIKTIEGILEIDKAGIFLSKPISNKYSFSSKPLSADCKAACIFNNKNEIQIPAEWLVEGAKITATVSDKEGQTEYNDWTITKVKRNGDTVPDYIAYCSSDSLKKQKWSYGAALSITIDNIYCDPIVITYTVTEYNDPVLGWDTVIFS